MELSFTAGDRAGIYFAEGEKASYRISRCPIVKEYILAVTPKGSLAASAVKYPAGHAKAGEQQSWFALAGAKAKAQSLETPGAKKSAAPKEKAQKAAPAPINRLASFDAGELGALQGALTALDFLMQKSAKSKSAEVQGMLFSLGLNARLRESLLEQISAELAIIEADKAALEAPLPTAEIFLVPTSAATIEREDKVQDAIEGALQDIKEDAELAEELASAGSLAEVE